jgi:predicted RNase H-like HicB family nuclease
MEPQPVTTAHGTYSVLIVPDGEGYSVFVPSLPGCFSQGATLEEARENAKEAIRVHIRGLQLDGEPVPQDRGVFVAAVAV